MKKPILGLGILLFIVFLFQARKKNLFRWDSVIPTSCKSVLVKIKKVRPENWKVKCEGNNLAIEILEINLPNSKEKEKIFLYRQLANHIIFIAKNSLNESLERMDYVRIKIEGNFFIINALSEGKYVARLAHTEDNELIMKHLENTVKIKETTK